MIRITDPGKLGPALCQVRQLLGLSRYELARQISARTGRSHIGIVNQIQQWDSGTHAPVASSLGPVLDALGYDLALVPRGDS
jgi:transcriptional regulator with XRE-family HTH domain